MIQLASNITQPDLDQISQIWLEANLDAHDFIPPAYWQERQEQVKELLPEASLFLAYHQSEIIGFLGLMDSYIAGIFVKKAYTSQGFGKALLAAAKAEASELHLSVYQKNATARQFYLKQGFEIQKEALDTETNELELEMTWRQV